MTGSEVVAVRQRLEAVMAERAPLLQQGLLEEPEQTANRVGIAKLTKEVCFLRKLLKLREEEEEKMSGVMAVNVSSFEDKCEKLVKGGMTKRKARKLLKGAIETFLSSPEGQTAIYDEIWYAEREARKKAALNG